MENRQRSAYPSYSDGSPFDGLPVGEVFRRIHEGRTWNYISNESVSGEGSTLQQTATLAAALPGLLRGLGVTSLLDLPCGDFNWMQQVDLQGFKYIGADIVAALVEKNNAQFASADRHFAQLDLLTDPLPACDLIFCRDCLVHLSFSDVMAALRNIKQCGITFLATTHFPEEAENQDIVTGGWRPLNFYKAPFAFPAPVGEINENCTEMDGMFADKSLTVWRVADL